VRSVTSQEKEDKAVMTIEEELVFEMPYSNSHLPELDS
jgi:hypothetical protein